MTEILSAKRERGQAVNNAHKMRRRASNESGKVATVCSATTSVADSLFRRLFAEFAFILLLDNNHYRIMSKEKCD